MISDLLLSGGDGRIQLLLEFALVHGVVPEISTNLKPAGDNIDQ